VVNGSWLKSMTLSTGTGADTVTVNGIYVPVTVNTGSGNDTIRMFPRVIFAPVQVDGQAGTDTIIYSLHTDEVHVNLNPGGWQSTDLTGLAGVENAVGGQGDDILVGNDGSNVLRGGPGRDILVGGPGRDVLDGGAGDDLLVGGTATHAVNLFAMDSFRSEWASANSYTVRRGHLKNGGGNNGIFVLVDGVSVLYDGAADQLSGGLGQDWFLPGAADALDPEPGEAVK
jgi:Ca2+-binding RTX toxin-like protein